MEKKGLQRVLSIILLVSLVVAMPVAAEEGSFWDWLKSLFVGSPTAASTFELQPFMPLCTPIGPEFEAACVNGLDDDCDGLLDCDDPTFCSTDPGCPPCVPTGVEVCDDEVDNDCDGATNCNDPDCVGDPACPPGCEPIIGPEMVCDDGIDDDCDGLIDLADPDCLICVATGDEIGMPECDDGEDNDCDGDIDCEDIDCEDELVCC